MNVIQIILAVICFFIVTNTIANDDNYFRPEWTAKCVIDKKPFELTFKSVSGFADDDDMVVSLKTLSGKIITLAIPEALYVPRSALTTEKNLCALSPDNAFNITAFSVAPTKVLLFLSKDARPGYNTLVLALIDVENGVLLDFIDTGYEIKAESLRTPFTLRKSQEKFEVKLVTDYVRNTDSDSAENFIENWVLLELQGDKIIVQKIKSL